MAKRNERAGREKLRSRNGGTKHKRMEQVLDRIRKTTEFAQITRNEGRFQLLQILPQEKVLGKRGARRRKIS